MGTLSTLLACLGPLFAFITLYSIPYLNTGEEKVDNKYIQYDSDGRAWCSLMLNATNDELYGKDEKVTDRTPIFTVVGHKWSRIQPNKSDVRQRTLIADGTVPTAARLTGSSAGHLLREDLI
uniref:Secreted protein n=1 Tax=Panagrellus redivivus TaxID=6233 RepID=A0A7E4ZQ91_PANRE